MIDELKLVALVEDLPQFNLKKGDLGTIVFVHEGGAAYEVEFTTLEGATIAVITVQAHQIRQIGPSEIAQSRVMTV